MRKNPVFLLILIIISTSSVGQPVSQSEVDAKRISDLRNTDLAASIELAESLWSIKQPSQHLEIGLELARSYAKSNLFEKVISISDNLLSEESISPKLKAQVLIQRFQAMTKLENWENQSAYIQQANQMSHDIGSNKLRSKLNEVIALLKYAQFDLADAELYFELAIKDKKQQEDKELAGLFRNLGVMRAQQGKLPGATSAMLDAMRTYESIGAEIPASLLSNLGGLSIYLEDWDKAIEYLERAVAVADHKKIGTTSYFSNLGTAYLGKGESQRALANFKYSLKISESLGKKNPTALNNIGYLLSEQELLQEALIMFQRAEKIYTERGRDEHLAIALKNIGETWIKLKNRLKAAKYLHRSYELYQTKNFRPKQIELFPVMIDNLEALGRNADALKFMREYKNLNDEMVNVDSKERIAELQSAFELEKKEKELIASERELANLEHNKVLKDKAFIELQMAEKELRNIRQGLIFVVGVLIVIGLILFKTNRFRAKTNQILRQKNDLIKGQHLELTQLNKQLEQQSQRDKLTGLHNRRYLTQYLEKYTAKLSRSIQDDHGKQQLVIMIDLDNFKQINDQFGHSVGDQVLCSFAETLQSCGRESDVQVRWGGEEFLWFCPDTPIEEAGNLCERLKRKFSDSPIEINGERINPTCSLGFAPFPIWGNPATDWEATVKVADSALYEAKYAGRNLWIGFYPDESTLHSNIDKNDFKKLIKDGRLVRLQSN